MYSIGVDIGGTSIKYGLVAGDTTIIEKRSIPFPKTDGRNVAKAIGDSVRELLKDRGIWFDEIDDIGVIIPGGLSADHKVVLDAFNLGFHNVPFYDMLKEEFPDTPLALGNDADAAALAELYCGAFKGHRSGVLFTLGTGIGGGIILDGKLFTGGMGLGSELGHTYLVDGGAACTCGNKGCIESYCSATALIRDYKETTGSTENIGAREIIEKATGGDAKAIEVWERYIDHLGSACASVFNLLNPEVIAIGGGVSGAGDVLFKPLVENAQKKIFFKTAQIVIVPASAGNDAGIIGAARLQ